MLRQKKYYKYQIFYDIYTIYYKYQAYLCQGLYKKCPVVFIKTKKRPFGLVWCERRGAGVRWTPLCQAQKHRPKRQPRPTALLRKSCILVDPMLRIRYSTSDFEAKNSSLKCFLYASHPLRLQVPLYCYFFKDKKRTQ